MSDDVQMSRKLKYVSRVDFLASVTNSNAKILYDWLFDYVDNRKDLKLNLGFTGFSINLIDPDDIDENIIPLFWAHGNDIKFDGHKNCIVTQYARMERDIKQTAPVNISFIEYYKNEINRLTFFNSKSGNDIPKWKLSDESTEDEMKKFKLLVEKVANKWRNDLEQTDDENLESLVFVIGEDEGKKIQYYTTKYERSRKNRNDAVRIHGLSCYVCGFNFEVFYGKIGKDYIEVHHLKPLHSRDEVVAVNPETDLICICSNCHRILHRKKDSIISPDELKNMIEEAKNDITTKIRALA